VLANGHMVHEWIDPVPTTVAPARSFPNHGSPCTIRGNARLIRIPYVWDPMDLSQLKLGVLVVCQRWSAKSLFSGFQHGFEPRRAPVRLVGAYNLTTLSADIILLPESAAFSGTFSLELLIWPSSSESQQFLAVIAR
jgi:hypothetical protein